MRHHALPLVLPFLLAGGVALAGEPAARRGAPPFTTESTADPATAARAAAQGYILPKGVIQEVVAPSDQAVRDCWLKHASPRARSRGDLRIDVMIGPNGVVWYHALVLAGPPTRRLARCLGDVVAAWRFPMRRAYTLASLPYHFVARGGAGPYKSCWNPRGCPLRPHDPQHEPQRP